MGESRTVLTIGTVKIDPPLILAPMAGATDLPFRVICREFGAGLVSGEMISDQALLHNNRRTLPLLAIDPTERPISLQLFGSDPEALARAAKILCRYEPDLIDLNFGCPVPKVVKNGAGAALLRDPSRAEAIVRAVVEAADRPVTVKMRSGWDDRQIVAPELARRCMEAGASAVMIHARTREQFYTGEADWSVIRDVVQAVAIPVIGNGDLRKPEDVPRLFNETGCRGAAIGQGALGNPWIFAKAVRVMAGLGYEQPSAAERFAVLRRHLRAKVEFSGETRGIKEMRKQIAWYLRGLPGAAHLRTELQTLPDLQSVLASLAAYEEYLETSWRTP